MSDSGSGERADREAIVRGPAAPGVAIRRPVRDPLVERIMTSPLPGRPTDIDREDPHIARRLLEERILEDPDERRVVYQMIGDCIDACAGSPAAFGLTLGAHRVALNVGWSRALQADRRQLELRVDPSVLDGETRSWARSVSRREKHLQDHEGALVWTFDKALCREAIPRLRDAVLASVRGSLASKGAGRQKDWQSHSAGALQVISSDLGRSLARPDYAVGSLRRHWKISPDVDGRLWGEWQRDGVATIGWEKLGDLRRFETRADFERGRAEVEMEDESYTLAAAGQVWDFRSIAPGDRILANRGTREILGVGEVVGGYEHRPDRDHHSHVVRVRWDRTVPIAVDKGRWRRALMELGKAEFEELVGTAVHPADNASSRPRSESFATLIDRLDAAGLRFSIEQIADLVLALQAKRFVILTGISGTGKTRIAMEFARSQPACVATERVVAVPADAVEVTVAPYMRKYARFVLPVEIAARIDLPRKVGGKSPRIVLEYPGGRLEQTVWRHDERKVSIVLLSKDARAWFRENMNEGDRFLLEPIDPDGTRPELRLTLPRVVAEDKVVENLLVLPVRPDWTDQRGLLGFYNPISERYVSTPFLDFLLRARSHPDQPFFAILDEMNLARVEHYFADFLSALESGEEFSLHDVEEISEGSDGGPAVPRRLRVPANLFFIGTVNVDESTYMFSPKVLDRAFTIEFDRVDLGDDPEERENSPLWITGMPERLSAVRPPEAADWRALDAEHRDAAQAVRVVHSILATEHRHFGYRVANEIARYVLLAAQQAGIEAVDAALDLALLHKVLPKLHGTQSELEPLIDRLFAFAVFGSQASGGDLRDVAGEQRWCVVGGQLVNAEVAARPSKRDATEPGGDAVALAEVFAPRFPRFGAKVFRMRARLVRHGFASFIE